MYFPIWPWKKLQNNWIYLPQINVLCPVREVHSTHNSYKQKTLLLVLRCLGRLLESLTVVLQQTQRSLVYRHCRSDFTGKALIGKQVRVGHNEPGLSSAEGGDNDW